MVCDNCGSGDAIIHLTQIVNNEMSTYHLCEKCAAEKGVQSSTVPGNFPLTDFLAQMGQDEGVSSGTEEGTGCAFCGLRFSDFRESGRLGCPHCYASFEAKLRSLLRKIHGSTTHVGKVYLPPNPTGSEVERRLDGLRRRLQRAVDGEDFERAAELRDQIRALEVAP